MVFAHKPHVCEGVLRVKGQPQNGASVSYGAADAAPFALYRRSELAPRHGYIAPPAVKPIVSFVEPLTGGEYYSHLDRNEVVADVLRTDGTDEFELVAEWPVWLVDPGAIAFGIWGYRPDYGLDNIRLIKVSAC